MLCPDEGKGLYHIQRHLFTIKPDTNAYQSYESYESLTPLCYNRDIDFLHKKYKL